MKQDGTFSWPFSRVRQERIASADRLSEQAGDLRGETYKLFAKPAPTSLRESKAWKKAARLNERAATVYSSAGLGLEAQRHLETAAEIYSQIGEEVSSLRSELAASSIMVFWA